MNIAQGKQQCWWADRRCRWPVGSVNSISMKSLTMKPLNPPGNTQQIGPQIFKDQLGLFGWVLPGAAEELTRGPKSRTGLLAGVDEALKGRADVAARARPLQPESQGPSTPQCLMTSARQATSAKPQSSHLPTGAKNFCLPGWALLWKINWIVLCKLKVRSERILCIGIVMPITDILNAQMHSISQKVA